MKKSTRPTKESGVYVVSSKHEADQEYYKFGRHTGTKPKLITRYQTYIIRPEVFFFRYVDNYKQVESDVLKALDVYRIRNDNDRKLEWLHLPLEIIESTINKVIAGEKVHPVTSYVKYEASTKIINKIYRDRIFDDNTIAQLICALYPKKFIYDTTDMLVCAQ
jgi:hypothetical protein